MRPELISGIEFKLLVLTYRIPHEIVLSASRFHSITLYQALHCHVREQQFSYHLNVRSEHDCQLDALFENLVSLEFYTSFFQKSGLTSSLHLHLLYTDEFQRLDFFRFQTDLYSFPNSFQYLRNSFTLSIATMYIWNFSYIHSIFILFNQNCEFHNTTFNILDISPYLNVSQNHGTFVIPSTPLESERLRR